MCELLAVSARFPTTLRLSLDELARHGVAISLMAGEVASLFLSRMTVPVVYFVMRRREERRARSQRSEVFAVAAAAAGTACTGNSGCVSPNS